MGNLKEKVSFYLDSATYKALKAAVLADKRKLSDWCRVKVEEALARRKA